MADPAPGISAVPHDDNLRYFNVAITGPEGSPFERTSCIYCHVLGSEAVAPWSLLLLLFGFSFILPCSAKTVVHTLTLTYLRSRSQEESSSWNFSFPKNTQ
jgi:hypothetical protein